MADRRRLLFVIPNLEHGGAERVVTQLAIHLPRDRFEVHMAVVERTGAFLADIPDDVPLHDLGAGRVRRAFWPLLKTIRELRPDVVLPNLGYLNLALLMLRPFLPRGTRLVPQAHTTLSIEVAGKAVPERWRRAYRWLYPRADAIICCSRAMADDLVDHFSIPRELMRVIHNPVDVRRVAAARGSESPFDGPGPHILGVGRLAPVKGYDRLVEAFGMVAVRRPEAQLWLLGAGDEEALLRTIASRLGVHPRMHLLGFQDDPFRYMAHADVFVQSSRREGLPVAVLEAIACGARVAAYDCPGGTREILAGLPGTVLVRDGDTRALADAIGLAIGPPPLPRPVLAPKFTLEHVIADYTRELAAI